MATLTLTREQMQLLRDALDCVQFREPEAALVESIVDQMRDEHRILGSSDYAAIISVFYPTGHAQA